MINEGIHSLLVDEKDILWMGSARWPEQLLAILRREQPDIILMDVNLPHKNGLDLCREVKENYPGIRIIGISTTNQASVIRKMMENGASGFILKDATKQEIIQAIYEVHSGKKYISHTISEILKDKSSLKILPALTKREKEILELLSNGLTNSEIAHQLSLDITTINSHRKNMLTKFQVKNIAGLLKIAWTNHLI
jgi:DNA-binding NarL/FixJ family response regulator